jgi:Mce-associated membrane protein
VAPARTSNKLTPDPEAPWTSRPKVVRTLSILTALGLVLGLLGVFLPKLIGGDDSYGDAEREKVISRAKDFATAYNTYDVANPADYQKRLKGLLTSGYDKQFIEVTNAVFTALKDKQQKSGEAKVRAVAIESIDDDSAEAIVAVDSTITNTDNKAAVLRHFRWKVSFTKSGNEWLVSNFESVAAVTATAGDPSATAPTPTPTTTEGTG